MVEAIAPMSMYFQPSEYTKKIKISTRCFVSECLHTLNHLVPELDNRERRWFENHPQFRHFFHMPKDPNHKLMGMWMFLLRTVRIERKKEAWFAVNGVPVRYGLREHALLSGLNCKNYPLNFKEKGSLRFVNKYFGVGATVQYQDIKDKLVEMEPGLDRLKMAVLYFLSSIIISPVKTGEKAPSVEPFFLRAVDDLKLCKTFPWGRLSFDHMLKEISRTMEHFRGEVKEGKTWVIPGFCLPLELLPFEAIPHLWERFREPCIGAEESCPRMCKSHFKKSEMRGFPLSRINEELGTSNDIESVMIPHIGEEDLLHDILEKEADVDIHDIVVESWMNRLKQGYTLFFEEMYKEDVAARMTHGEDVAEPQTKTSALPAPSSGSTPHTTQMDDVIAAVTTMTAALEGKMVVMEGKFESLEARVQKLEEKVAEGDKRSGKRPRKE